MDGLDEEKSNWMRYVNPAHSQQEQNLAACQNGMNIYFYTVKAIPADQELLVWYCPEFAHRLNYPASGEIVMQKLSKFTKNTNMRHLSICHRPVQIFVPCYLTLSQEKHAFPTIEIDPISIVQTHQLLPFHLC